MASTLLWPCLDTFFIISISFKNLLLSLPVAFSVKQMESLSSCF